MLSSVDVDLSPSARPRGCGKSSSDFLPNRHPERRGGWAGSEGSQVTQRALGSELPSSQLEILRRLRAPTRECPSPRRSGEKVPKADEGSRCESKAGPLTPASRISSVMTCLSLQQPGEHQIRDLLRVHGELVLFLREDPRGHHLVEHAEHRLGHQLRMEGAPEAAV